MTDWQKAREAAARKLCEFVGLHADDEGNGVFVWQREALALDAALSAFEKAGYFMIGIDELRVLLRKGSTALERYESKYAAALEERQT